jgi:hypothetical protein
MSLQHIMEKQTASVSSVISNFAHTIKWNFFNKCYKPVTKHSHTYTSADQHMNYPHALFQPTQFHMIRGVTRMSNSLQSTYCTVQFTRLALLPDQGLELQTINRPHRKKYSVSDMTEHTIQSEWSRKIIKCLVTTSTVFPGKQCSKAQLLDHINIAHGHTVILSSYFPNLSIVCHVTSDGKLYTVFSKDFS